MDELKFNNVEELIFKASENFILKAKNRLRLKRKTFKGNLQDLGTSVQISEDYILVTIGYEKDNPASGYFSFVDKGVKGLKNTANNAGTPYKYKKTPSKTRGSLYRSLIEWYTVNRAYIKNEDKTKRTSILQQKRAKIGTMKGRIESIAWATRNKIRREGIERTGFLEDTKKEVFNKQFLSEIATALGKDLVLNIKENFRPK